MDTNLHKLLNDITRNVPGAKLAKCLKKSPSYVSQMRSDKQKQVPTPETLARLAKEFDMSSRLPELFVAALYEQVGSLTFKEDPDGSLKQLALSAVEQLHDCLTTAPAAKPRTSGRTLADFPESFYPLAVVTGDKREERGSMISVGDLGVYSATPGDTRWIMNLGLRPDVVKHIDKNFVLLSEKELIDEFANVNLLVVGSPASNHLARIINSSAIFRFNYIQDIETAIKDIITKASGLSTELLGAYREDERNRLSAKVRSLFTGGIFDPTHPDSDYIAAHYSQRAINYHFDFGVLTFAANPYYVRKCELNGIPESKCKHEYISIMAAGIHHPATAHALRLLGQDCRKKGIFDEHPYGGAIRVQLDQNTPFSKRTVEAPCEWEDVADSERTPSNDQKKLLLEQLEIIKRRIGKKELKNLALTEKQSAECHWLIEKL